MANTVIAKGTASISVNPQETEAKLVFAPDPEGLGWDLDAINKIAMEAGLSPPPSPKLVEPFLQKASRARDKNPMEILLYQGIPPENPVPETIAWETLPVPADMAPYQAETMEKAPAPEIFRVRIEKIKKESIVKKPGPLPFLPPKEDVVVTWDKKEIREAVEVNPKPREIMYADRGKKLGTLSPPKPGKPGTSVFGRPLPPPAGGESGFLFGAGIVREKNEAAALYSGFLRIGENWADMVPLSKPSYTITIGADGLTPFFNFVPGDSRFPLPTGEEVLAKAPSEGVSREALVDPGVLDNAMREASGKGEPIEVFPLFAAREAEARVDINQDQTKAVLYLRKGVAGALPLEMKTINQVIRDSRVGGFDVEKLKTALKTFMESTELELKGYVLAEGSPSARGKDREVQLEAAPLADEVKKPLLERLKGLPRGARGSPLAVSPEEATVLALVEKGAVIAQVSSSSEGEAGKDIFGNIIPGLPGNDPDLKLFRGLEQHGAKIIAAQEGLLLIKAGEKSFRGEVLDYRDGKADITISDDAMEVRGDFTREIGAGTPLTVENIHKALDALGVKRGIDRTAVERARHLAYTRGSAAGQILARGEAPVAKGGMGIRWHVPVDPAAPLMPAGGIQVEANFLIAEITGEEKEGKKGYDVRGAEIPSEQGGALRIGHDESIKELPVPAQGGAA
ncbi:MAG: FapA family protein, partial [Treponema sp.]|nr:FapA family protein [Treponema sp.]